MNSVPSLRPRQSLGPDELHIAADAFESAVRALSHSVGMPSARVREILACYITERAFMGERDADTLRNDALACLDILAEASATPASAFVGCLSTANTSPARSSPWPSDRSRTSAHGE
jgi:hypothetical protein